MTYAANDVVLGRHLDTAEKRIKREIDKIAAGGASIAVFTGATTDNGTSGLVPAPQAGDNRKFLRGDGVWATVESGSSGGGAGYVIGSKVSSIEGGFWQGTINDTPVLKLRHGDYEYNFAYDNITYIGGASSVLETVTPNTYILGTASVSNDGGVWYGVDANNVPTLNLHMGNFNYGFNYDSITYKGDNSHLAAYLPFDVSTTVDACGNEWTTVGNVTLDTTIKKFGEASLHTPAGAYIRANNVIDLNADKWTFDCWCYAVNRTNAGVFCLGSLASKKGITVEGESASVANSDGSGWAYETYHSTLTQLNQWTHLAVVRDGGHLYFFEAGQLFWHLENVGTIYDNAITAIGGDSWSQDMNLYFDNVRIHNGVALWTSNFTPPTAEDYL